MRTALRPRFWCAAVATLACIIATPALAQRFQPNESLVSPQKDLIDPEFSQARAKVAWVDATGSLWIADIDRTTGLFNPPDGKGTRIDADAMTAEDLKLVGNGPEWIGGTNADQIVYTKFQPGKPHTRATARLAMAQQQPGGAWAVKLLSSQPRNAPYASQDAGDPAPRISYVDPLGNHYWKDVTVPGSENLVAAYPPSYRSLRFVRGERAAVFTAPVNGVSQVFRYVLDTQVVEQLTFDGGQKDLNTVPWMWRAPEFGNAWVLSTVVDDKELRIYRQDGTAWTLVNSTQVGPTSAIHSPEPFTHNGRSYVFFSTIVPPHDYFSAIYLSSIDPARPLLRRLTVDEPARARTDPEVFVTRSGPYIYYTRLDPALARPGQGVNYCIACSEGVYRAWTGLGPAAEADK